jgi:signal transduction histidine kinase
VAREHLIGQSLHAFFHGTGRAALRHMLREAMHGAARAELTIARADGTSIPIYLSLSVLPRDGDTPLLCGVVTDLSEQKYHLRELEAANARLLEEMAERAKVDEALKHLQKVEAIGKLAAGVAHDFNNILQSIVGCLEMVLDEMAEGTPGRRFAGVALDAASRGASLTHHLLSYARRQVLLPRVVALAPFLADLRTLLGRTLGPNIAIAVRVEATRGVLVDPGQLETALLNLAINAAHAMKQGGTLTIDAHDAPDGQPFVVIAVTDTGIGMDAATLAQVGEPFFTTKGSEGTGLGLPMVQGFVEQSGGTFSIDSAPGRGTRIQLRLPSGAPGRRPGARPGAGQDRPDPGAPERRGRILLVDDSSDLLVVAGACLEKAGFAVVRAESGNHALALLEGTPLDDIERFDALVTDYAMPDLNGVDLISECRRIHPGLPAVIITGFANTLHAAALPERTVVLRKPYQYGALVTALRDIMAWPADQ